MRSLIENHDVLDFTDLFSTHPECNLSCNKQKIHQSDLVTYREDKGVVMSD